MQPRAGRWTRAELIRTLLLYASFKANERNTIPAAAKETLRLRLKGRTFASVALRLANFVNRDPEMRKLGLKGLEGGGVEVDLLWQECSDDFGNLLLEKVARLAALEDLNS